MSINAINGVNTNPNKKLENRIMVATGVGFVAGTAGVGSRKNWLYKGQPSDTFVKNVSNNLAKKMTPEEKEEAGKINIFLKAVVNPETNMDDLKPQIRESKELSDAIKSTPEENVEDAINRVFSNPNKEEVKQNLLDLQDKTVSHKKSGKNTALKLVHDNFSSQEKKLVKNENTSEEVFGMLKKTAKKIQVKTALLGGVVAGLVAGAACLIASDVPDLTKDKK